MKWSGEAVDDSSFWFAARVRVHTEKKIKEYLTETNIRHYIPFQFERPVIPCLIFVYATKEEALLLPQISGFVINYIYNMETKQLLVVPHKQMQDFMFVMDLPQSSIAISNERLRKGKRVRVIKGEFAGIEGELTRIKGHKRVVIRLEGLFSFVTTYIPREYIEVIE